MHPTHKKHKFLHPIYFTSPFSLLSSPPPSKLSVAKGNDEGVFHTLIVFLHPLDCLLRLLTSHSIRGLCLFFLVILFPASILVLPPVYNRISGSDISGISFRRTHRIAFVMMGLISYLESIFSPGSLVRYQTATNYRGCPDDLNETARGCFFPFFFDLWVVKIGFILSFHYLVISSTWFRFVGG